MKSSPRDEFDLCHLGGVLFYNSTLYLFYAYTVVCLYSQSRVSALNMWLNNAEALISGIVSVGATIGVEKMPCVSLSSGVSVF